MEPSEIAARLREQLMRAGVESEAAEPILISPSAWEPPSVAPADRNGFIAEAYRVVVGRDATPAEILHHARKMRFVGFYFTPRRFLGRLRETWEAVAFAERNRLRHERYVTLRLDEIETRQAKQVAELRQQIQALQRALTEVSYKIVDDVVERTGAVARSN